MNNIHLYFYGREVVQGTWCRGKPFVSNRLYYVNSGTATIFNSTKEYVLTAGKAYIIPQCNDFHTITSKDFDHTFFDYYSSRTLNPGKTIVFDEENLPVKQFFNYINAIISDDTKNLPRKAIEDLLSGFLGVMESTTDLFEYISTYPVSRAVDIIHSDCAHATTKSLAEELNLNESYFIRLFRNTFGISPMKYIRTCRVLYGKELLKGGESVDKVSEKCGYSSSAAFYKAVMTELGEKPSDLKKQFSSIHIKNKNVR